MQRSTLERFKAVIAAFSERELAFRRDYYVQLKAAGHESTFQEYFDEYADYARFGAPATDDLIRQAQALSTPSFPTDLLEFYRSVGCFESIGSAFSELKIFSLENRVDHSKSTDKYDVLPSMGVVDVIRHLWVNDRPEFEPEGGRAIVSPEEISYLNRNFSCVGYWMREEDIGESHDLIYFDREGRFGTLYVHQDYFDILHLLDHSPAAQTWDEVLNESLDRAMERAPSD